MRRGPSSGPEQCAVGGGGTAVLLRTRHGGGSNTRLRVRVVIPAWSARSTGIIRLGRAAVAVI
jgi:hypothetical protein